MTKPLPPGANIEWLRKAAKAVQKSWRADGRTTKLSEAQFSVAQEYGFTSWRALKAYFDDGLTPEQADAFLSDVGHGNLNALKAALKENPSLVNCSGNHPFWGGKPHPFHVAIDTNREDVFDLLIAAGADLDGKSASYDNWSPLMLALSWDRAGMVRTLTQLGATENICTALLRADDTALDRYLATEDWHGDPVPSGSLIGLARTPHAVHQLIKAGVSPLGQDRWGADAMETLSRLGQNGAPLVAALAEHGTAPSAEAFARLGDQAKVKELSAKDPSVITDPKVVTAAVDFGHINLVEWLLANGADPNARQDFGSKGTALHSAAWNGNALMVQCLLDHSADTAAVDEEYRTPPLSWAKAARQVTNNPECDEIVRILEKHQNLAIR
jgi:ankyrin repeat protein